MLATKQYYGKVARTSHQPKNQAFQSAVSYLSAWDAVALTPNADTQCTSVELTPRTKVGIAGDWGTKLVAPWGGGSPASTPAPGAAAEPPSCDMSSVATTSLTRTPRYIPSPGSNVPSTLRLGASSTWSTRVRSVAQGTWQCYRPAVRLWARSYSSSSMFGCWGNWPYFNFGKVELNAGLRHTAAVLRPPSAYQRRRQRRHRDR